MDETSTSPASPDSPGMPPAGKKKKKDKVRDAWISFVGRIVAQIVGAVASIVLAVMFVQRTQSNNAANNPPQTLASTAAPAARPARAARADGRITLAVLPLDNFSGSSQDDYFADGMTEALIADLAQIGGLRVISRTSVMQYRTHQKSAPQIADELGADMIVEGSVLRAGDRVRVTAQLIDASSDDHLWARSYERTMRDVLSLQGQLAAEIAKEVKGALSPIQQGRLSQRKAIDPAVYDLYLRGRHAWNLRTDDGFAAAASYFQQAIDKDPEFALAYAGLADVYALPRSLGRPAINAESRAKALAAATRALALDDALAEAHTSRAALHLFHDRNRPAAEAEFRRALELNPDYPTARQWYAILLSEVARDGEALEHAREAVALDPLSGTMRQTLGLVHYYGRRYAEAATTLRRAIELAPQLPLARAMLAKSLFQQGLFAEVVKVGESVPEPRTADLLAITALAYLRSGDAARANAILKELRSRNPLPIVPLAQWYAVAGDRDAAIALLTRADTLGSVPPPVAVDPLFDSLRADPRFAALLNPGRL